MARLDAIGDALLSDALDALISTRILAAHQSRSGEAANSGRVTSKGHATHITRDLVPKLLEFSLVV
jgi:hypothetical protein